MCVRSFSCFIIWDFFRSRMNGFFFWKGLIFIIVHLEFVFKRNSASFSEVFVSFLLISSFFYVNFCHFRQFSAISTNLCLALCTKPVIQIETYVVHFDKQQIKSKWTHKVAPPPAHPINYFNGEKWIESDTIIFAAKYCKTKKGTVEAVHKTEIVQKTEYAIKC